jgi:hypothetical protein
MIKFDYRLSAAIVGVAFCLVQPQLSIAALSIQQIDTISKQITVKIEGPDVGSGVIIERSGNNYVVLTCRHVFYSGGGQGRYIPGRYTIQTSDGDSYPVYSRREIPGLDLVELQFESDKNYRTAELANSDEIKKSATIYASGWTRESSKLGRVYNLTVGYFKERLPNPENGYALVITNSILPGMSGGPMLDENARLLGIHGQVAPGDQSLRLGIPINAFLASRNKNPSPVPSPLPNPTPNPPTPPAPSQPEIPFIPLTSSRGINYTKLRNLLAQGKWKEADFETSSLLLKLGKRTKEGWLRAEDIKIMSCEDLKTIDRLWVAYSRGKFGFSVQVKIYQSLAGRISYNQGVWNKFGDRVGWRANNRWLYYPELNFDLQAPEGSFPIPVRYSTVDSRQAASLLLNRFAVCQF